MKVNFSGENGSKVQTRCVIAISEGQRTKMSIDETTEEVTRLNVEVAFADGEEVFRKVIHNALAYCIEKSIRTVHVSLFMNEYSVFYAINNVVEVAAEEFEEEFDMNLSIGVPMRQDYRAPIIDGLSANNIEIRQHVFGDINDSQKREFEAYVCEGGGDKSGFREHLLELMERKGIKKDSDLYKKAQVSKSTFSKIMSFAKHSPTPARETLAAFAVALHLSVDEAQTLYNKAGYYLGTSGADKVIRYFLEKQPKATVLEVNQCLFYYGFPLLGVKSRNNKEEVNVSDL